MERPGDEWRTGKKGKRKMEKSLNAVEVRNTIYIPHKSSRVSGEMLVEEGYAVKNRLRANEEKSCVSCFRRKKENQINYNY